MTQREPQANKDMSNDTTKDNAKTLEQILPSAALLTLSVGAGLAGQAQAATFTVTNTNDAGAGSLRDAIAAANAAGGADIIDFQAGLTGTITLTTGQLNIADSVQINGPGAANLSVSGNNASRVFYLYAGGVLDVQISNLTITGGTAVRGGGILNTDENLTLDGVVIQGNTATSHGGGIFADGFNMNLTIRNSTITGNTSGANGGGMYVEDTGGPLLIDNSSFTNNDASGSGGGIYFYDPDNSITINNSTIAGNVSGAAGRPAGNAPQGLTSRGGGVYLYHIDGGGPGRPLVITNSTFSTNSAGDGGGIYLDDPVTLTLQSSTISGNTSVNQGGGVRVATMYSPASLTHSTVVSNTSGAGGGISLGTGTGTIVHSVIADNTGGATPDLAGTFTQSFSLVRTPTGATVTDGGGNLAAGTAPNLGALANNGGPTATHLPLTGSPLINAGNAAFAPPPNTDQRGLARVSGGRIDIGAVETVATSTLQFAVTTASIGETGGTVSLNVARVGDTSVAVSVNYASANGTATAGADYTTANGTLNWAVGDAADKTITVPILDDALVEGPETFTLTLSGPSAGAVLGANTAATVTIADDDAGGTVQFSVASITVNENAGTATLTVTRAGGNSAASVDYATAPGSATSPADFTATTGTLNWAAGDTSNRTITVPIINDTLPEGTETFTVTLSNPQGGVAVGTGTATVSILNASTSIPAGDTTGKILLAGLLALGGLAALRKRVARGGGMAAVIAALALGGVSTSSEAAGVAGKDVRQSRVTAVETQGANVTLRLADGSTITAPANVVVARDKRAKHSADVVDLAKLPTIDAPTLVKVRRDASGAITRVRVVLLNANDGDLRKR